MSGFNDRLATRITAAVSTMTCAWIFAVIALVSLPAAVVSGSVIVIVAWVAQTFLQLVLLSIIMVGQKLQASKTDAIVESHDKTHRLVAELHRLHIGGNE
jgi:hypothetical protein